MRARTPRRSEEHTSELQSPIDISYAVFCLKKKNEQNNDPSLHGETDAFRNAGRQRSYRKLTMVTTLAPCWYCSGLIRQFGFPRVIVGESRTFQGGIDWLRSLDIEVIDLDSQECVTLLSDYIQRNPAVWH